MIDLYWTECTRELSIFFVCIYVLFVVIYYKKNVLFSSSQNRKVDYGMYLYSIILIIIVSASSQSDWFHYQQQVWEFDFSPKAHRHMEPIYDTIIKIVDRNYLLFRIIVWGGAFLLVDLVFRRFRINQNSAVFFLIAAFLLIFNYARSTLAMTCYFYGLSHLLIPMERHRLLSYTLVVLSFWGAYSFHHSLIVLVLLTIFIYIPLNKFYVIIIMLIGLPSFALFMGDSFELVDRIENEQIVEKLYIYKDMERGNLNLLGILRYFIEYGAFLLPIVITTIVMAKNYRKIETPIVRLHRIMIATTVFSLSFLFMDLDNQIMFYRILYMSFIPITIITNYLLRKRLITVKYYSFILIWGITSCVYPLLYAIYIVT